MLYSIAGLSWLVGWLGGGILGDGMKRMGRDLGVGLLGSEEGLTGMSAIVTYPMRMLAYFASSRWTENGRYLAGYQSAQITRV
jgi:hypothetical protein